MDQGLLRDFLSPQLWTSTPHHQMPEPPVLDAMVQRELERIRHLEDAGQITQAEGNALIERAYDALDAELERRELPKHRYDCEECGGVGSRPAHRLDCSRWRRPR
jgi:hypothetical protein